MELQKGGKVNKQNPKPNNNKTQVPHYSSSRKSSQMWLTWWKSPVPLHATLP